MNETTAPHTEACKPDSTRGRRFVLATYLDGRAQDGGGYVHKLGVLRVLAGMQSPTLKVHVICDSDENKRTAESAGLQATLQRRTNWHRLTSLITRTDFSKYYLGRKIGPKLSAVDRLLTYLNVDLILFPAPDPRALEIYSHDYVFSIWDLAHLEHPEFPEASKFGEFERRERVYRGGARRAIAVIADSGAACTLIAETYRVSRERIFSAPFLFTPEFRRFERNLDKEKSIRQKYELSGDYIFYPAQFWSHKNHRYIIRALRVMLDRYNWAPQAVFCGADKGALSQVLALARDLNVLKNIKYCGFVPSDELPYLYAGSMALVMPTYFGPTNIPPMEAACLGVPVCYSDFPAFREFMGESAFYMNLQDPGSLAKILHKLRESARQNGTKTPRGEVRMFAENDAVYRRLISKIIEQYRVKIGLGSQTESLATKLSDRTSSM